MKQLKTLKHCEISGLAVNDKYNIAPLRIDYPTLTTVQLRPPPV
jgi:hypothetical protein